MSSPLAIAGVTAVLRNLLDNAFIEAGASGVVGNKVTVTSLPPDAIAIDGPNAQTQLNLFLYEVTPNLGWRNEGLPSRGGRGERLSNPPLALDLHYLLTAYGAEELHAEILLGYAMSVLHEHPVLDRQSVRDALTGGTLDTAILPAAFQALTASDLADQVELVKLTPEAMGSEEMSRLWAALQAHYRPTACYQASVVLIDSRQPVRAALPVLTRGPVDPTFGRERGVVATGGLIPPYPALTAVRPPNVQIAARLGDTVVLEGMHLDGADPVVRFEHSLLEDAIELAPVGTPTATRIEVALPNDNGAAAAWPAGVWSVSLAVQRLGDSAPRTSNGVPMLLAPSLMLAPGETTVARDGTTGAVTVHLLFRPQVRPGQQVRLQVGGHEAASPVITAPAGTLDFVFPQLETGDRWLRLRVDGVDSLLIERASDPPQFDPSQQVTVPA
jgi:hypothetical protein